MKDLSEFARGDDVFRERHRWEKAIVVHDEIGQLRLLNCLHHRLALLAVKREWLLAHDHLAVLDARECDFHV